MLISKYQLYTIAFALVGSSSLLNSNHHYTMANELELEKLMADMEDSTLSFAKYVESLISVSPIEKCSYLRACSENNFDGCKSEFTMNAECPGNDYSIKECSGGFITDCGGIFDFTVSRTSLAPSRTLNEDHHHIIDDVCSTLPAEEYMTNFHQESIDKWNKYDVLPPWIYYGSSSGVFRMYPANPSKCDGINNSNDYDPRKRPWFVAGSSGPKDVVLVLDTSGSMDNLGRMEKLKEAAHQVIDSLTAGDYFAIVEFNNYATQLGPTQNFLTRAALAEEKAYYKQLIHELTPGGGTNYNSGFQKAFDILENTGSQDMTSNCRQAILFVSDGENNNGETQNPILYDLINQEMAKYTSRNKEPPTIFTYSFGDQANEEAPKQIACLSDGIWAQITDEQDLSESMGAYHKYFSYGLSDASNADFVAWSPPYVFSTGGGLGITVSAPVYDRNAQPPILAGVVGFDFSFQAMEKAFGSAVTEEARDKIIQRIVDRSRARCPVLELNDCQKEALRRAPFSTSSSEDNDGGNNALCNKCDLSSIPNITSLLCQDSFEYDKVTLWQNSKNDGWSYEERTCCHVGEEIRSLEFTQQEAQDQTCSANRDVPGEFYIALCILSVLIVLFCIFCSYRMRKTKKKPPTQQINYLNGIGDAVVPLPPPTAPGAL